MPFIPEHEYQKHLSDRQLGYAFLDSAYQGLSKSIVWSLENGVSVDTLDEKTGMTALHMAVGRNNLEFAQSLSSAAHRSCPTSRAGCRRQ